MNLYGFESIHLFIRRFPWTFDPRRLVLTILESARDVRRNSSRITRHFVLRSAGLALGFGGKTGRRRLNMRWRRWPQSASRVCWLSSSAETRFEVSSPSWCGARFPRTSERGSVTAELACVMPALLIVLSLSLGALATAAQQLRLADKVTSAARLLARGEDPGPALSGVREAIGSGSVATEVEGRFVCVSASAPAAFAPFRSAGVTVTAKSCALAGGL
jgi:hypothetical protein